MREGLALPFFGGNMANGFCVSLIGMPGAGKSTIGQILANMLQYAFVDTDYLLESLYARRLQDVTEALGREEFLDAEGKVIAMLRGKDSVIATGGSAIYRPHAMQHLRRLGPVIHLRLAQDAVAERVALNPERGISFGPGQTLADLYAERMILYARYCDFVCDTDALPPSGCAELIAEKLAGWQGRAC